MNWRCVFLAAMLVAATGAAAAEPRLEIVGAGRKPVLLSPADIAALPRASVTATFQDKPLACEGAWLTDVLIRGGAEHGDKLGAKSMTRVVVATGAGRTRVAFTLGELDRGVGNAPVLVADRCDGAALPPADGPLRLIAAADKRDARSVRQLVKLEVIP